MYPNCTTFRNNCFAIYTYIYIYIRFTGSLQKLHNKMCFMLLSIIKMSLCPSRGAVPYILKTTALIQQLRGLVSSFDVNHKYVQQWRNTLFAWQVAIYLSYRCSVCVCHQVVYTQWPTHCICNCMYYWLGQAVSWAFSSWPRSFVDFTASSSSSHKTVFVDSEVNKGSLKLNTSSSKRKTVKILREGSDLSREGWLKSTRRHHTSTYF